MKSLKGILAAAVLAMSAGQASAAPTILGDYYEEHVTESDFSAVEFSPVPTGKVLVVRRVSCRFGSITFPIVDPLTLRVNATAGRVVYSNSPVFLRTYASNGTTYTMSLLNLEVDFLVYSGKAPVFGISGASFQGFMECTLTGELMPASSVDAF